MRKIAGACFLSALFLVNAGCSHGGGVRVVEQSEIHFGRYRTANVKVIVSAEKGAAYEGPLREALLQRLNKCGVFNSVQLASANGPVAALNIVVELFEINEGAEFLGMEGDGYVLKTRVALIPPSTRRRLATLEIDGDDTAKRTVGVGKLSFKTQGPRSRALHSVGHNLCSFLKENQ